MLHFPRYWQPSLVMILFLFLSASNATSFPEVAAQNKETVPGPLSTPAATITLAALESEAATETRTAENDPPPRQRGDNPRHHRDQETADDEIHQRAEELQRSANKLQRKIRLLIEESGENDPRVKAAHQRLNDVQREIHRLEQREAHVHTRRLEREIEKHRRAAHQHRRDGDPERANELEQEARDLHEQLQQHRRRLAEHELEMQYEHRLRELESAIDKADSGEERRDLEIHLRQTQHQLHEHHARADLERRTHLLLEAVKNFRKAGANQQADRLHNEVERIVEVWKRELEQRLHDGQTDDRGRRLHAHHHQHEETKRHVTHSLERIHHTMRKLHEQMERMQNKIGHLEERLNGLENHEEEDFNEGKSGESASRGEELEE